MPTADELCNQADQLKEEGKLDEAVVKYQEALAMEPDNVLGHLALSVLLTKMTRHDEAIKHAYRATELEPNDAFGYSSLSITLQRAGKFLEAEDALARAKMLHQGM
jgi:tetratricopeptide (TPR) repeat protein